jgi:hypothetical protein
MAGHGVELQRVIPKVMNGNVRIVALDTTHRCAVSPTDSFITFKIPTYRL